MSIQFPVFSFEDDSIYEYTKCSICNGQLKDPRQLPCLHTFCFDCLEDYTNIDYQTNEINDINNNSLFESILHKTSNLISNNFGGAQANNKNLKLTDFQCPICRKKVAVPPGGLSQLPQNVFIEKLLEIHGTSDKKDVHSNVVCQICRGINFCGGSNADVVAIKFCADCKQHLCHRCVEYHRLLNTTNSHKLLTIGSDQELMHRVDDVSCKVHTSEIVDVYCKTCNKALCRLCFSTSDHSGHSGCGILEASLELKEQIQSDAQDLYSELEYIKRSLYEVDEVADRFNTSLENIENSIQNKEEELKAVLIKHSEKLRREIENKKYIFNKELDKVKESLEGHKIILEEYSKYSQLLLYKATPGILVCSAKEVNSRFKELRKSAPVELSCEIEPFFTPSKIATEVVLNRKMSICGGVPAGTIRNKILSEGTIDDNLIGFLEFKTKYSKKCMASLTITKQPVVMQTFPFNDYAIALALVDDDDEDYLCCATYSSSELVLKEASVLRNNENKKLGLVKNETMNVPGLKNPFSMAVVGDYLFISEWQSDKLHKIKILIELSTDKNDESSTYERLMLGSGEGLNALSATKDNKYLIVTCPEIPKLKLIDVNGTIIRQIPLDSSINKPYHAIQLNDDDGQETMFITQTENETNATFPKERIERYVVSQAGDLFNRIILIDGSGKMLATYGSMKGGPGAMDRKMSTYNFNSQQTQTTQEQLNGPYRICADLVNNLVFVSDHYNHRILLLDSRNLKHIRELISPTFGLSYPLDLCFDTNRQLLHVADLDNKRFITFKFN